MPPPGKPYYPFAAAGLSADEIAEIDPDYLYFLRHVHLCGRSYALEIPSQGGASPPEVIRYEEPIAGRNAGAPVAGSGGGGRGTPSPMEKDSSAASEAPNGVASPPAAGVKRKAPEASPNGEARNGAVAMEEDLPAAPVAEPAWYDTDPDIDEDYRFFLQHLHVVNDAKAVFKMGDFSMTVGGEDDDDNAEEEEEQEEKEDDDDDDDDEEEPIHASGESGEDSVSTEEEEEEEEEESVDAEGLAQKDDVDEEEEDNEEEVGDEGEEKAIAVSGEDAVGNEEKSNGYEYEKEVGAGLDLQMVNDLEFEVVEEVKAGEQPLDALVMETPKSEPLNREASSSMGHSAIPHNASEFQGTIWPRHIIERPNSDFKENLMKILLEPFNQKDYDKLVNMATKRSPVVKERRTRQSVVYYPWEHEMGKSYFDNYPDLYDQFKLESNSYPNRMALLRGFFFWLKNVGQENQFRPWRDDYKKYRVVPFMGGGYPC